MLRGRAGIEGRGGGTLYDAAADPACAHAHPAASHPRRGGRTRERERNDRHPADTAACSSEDLEKNLASSSRAKTPVVGRLSPMAVTTK